MNVTQAVVLLGAGLPPISATVTNSVAVFPGYVASVYGSRTDLRDLAAKRGVRAILGLAPTVVLGTALGCTLLLNTPPRTFDFVVPFLVLGATTVLAFQERLKELVGRPHESSPRRATLALHAAAGFGAVYGGYFNAALGAGAVLAYAIFGPVDWAAAAVLTPATLLGGYVGARLARRLPSTALRLVIVAFGLVVGVVLLIRALT